MKDDDHKRVKKMLGKVSPFTTTNRNHRSKLAGWCIPLGKEFICAFIPIVGLRSRFSELQEQQIWIITPRNPVTSKDRENMIGLAKTALISLMEDYGEDPPLELIVVDDEGNLHGNFESTKKLIFLTALVPKTGVLAQWEVDGILTSFAQQVDEGKTPSQDVLKYIGWGIGRYLAGHNNPWPKKTGRKEASKLFIAGTYNANRICGHTPSQAEKNTAAMLEIDQKTVKSVLKNSKS